VSIYKRAYTYIFVYTRNTYAIYITFYSPLKLFNFLSTFRFLSFRNFSNSLAIIIYICARVYVYRTRFGLRTVFPVYATQPPPPPPPHLLHTIGTFIISTDDGDRTQSPCRFIYFSASFSGCTNDELYTVFVPKMFNRPTRFSLYSPWLTTEPTHTHTV